MGNKINLIAAIISFLATSLAVGIIIYTEVIYQHPLPDNEQEFKELKKDRTSVNTAEGLKLDRLTINIRSPRTRLRYLDITLNLIPFRIDQIGILEDKKPIINDTIIDIAGQMSPNNLNSVAGKILLEERIKTRINKRLHQKIIKEIYFSHFVVQ